MDGIGCEVIISCTDSDATFVSLTDGAVVVIEDKAACTTIEKD